MANSRDDKIEALEYANASEIKPTTSKLARYCRRAGMAVSISLALILIVVVIHETSGSGGSSHACALCAAEKHSDTFYIFGVSISRETRVVESKLTECLLPYLGGSCSHNWKLIGDSTPWMQSCGRGNIMFANTQFADWPSLSTLTKEKLADDPKFVQRIQKGLESNLLDLPEMKLLLVKSIDMDCRSAKPVGE